jgi:hypothetical protein
MSVLRLQADQNRLKDHLTVDELIQMQEGNFRVIRDVLSRFVLQEDSDELMPEEEAVKVLGSLTIRQLEETAKKFMGATENSIVPLNNGAA